MHVNIKGIILFLTFLIFGIVVSMQIKTIVENNKIQAELKIKDEEYIRLISEENKKKDYFLALIEQNEKKKENALNILATFEKNNALKKITNKLDEVKLKTGLSNVKGPGIIITMNDALSTKNLPDDTSVMQLIIHDSDILKLINELKIAGAQAISINDERLIATSEIICAGPTMLINSNKLSVPFVIKVIGDEEKLFKTVEESDRVHLMKKDGLRIDVEKNAEIIINKYNYDVAELTSSLEVAK